MPAADLRGFRDPLAALRKQREWRLDAALAAAARARAQLAQAKLRHEEAMQEFDVQAGRAADAWVRRPDPGAQLRLLPYLAQQHAVTMSAAQEAERLEQAFDEAQELVVRRQQELEALERHREDLLARFHVDQERKASAEMDRDWIARAALAGGGSA